MSAFDELGQAIRADDVTRARAVLAAHSELAASLDQPMPGGDFGSTCLLTAVYRRNREMVDLLLDAGAGINVRSHWWAGGFGVLDNDSGLADYLIGRGATVDAYAAARHGRLEDLARLLAADASAVHMRGGDGQTPLHVAATPAIADLLLERGADINALDVDHESTPAQYAIGDRPDVARYLVERGCATDLLLVSALGDAGRVRAHVSSAAQSIGMSVSEEWFPKRNPRSGGSIYIWTLGDGKTPHLVAHERGHTDVFALLMSVSPADRQLATACDVGDETLVRQVRASHPDVLKTMSESTARRLVSAAQRNDDRAVRLMLDAGWRADVRGADGVTALHWAAWLGNAAMAQALLRSGASRDAVEARYGGTPLGWARHGQAHGDAERAGGRAAVIAALEQPAS
jgi:ankyrin repeat protein